ncbi:MAG: hypothetical protein HKN92_02455 [Chitinophagales bacterium]|nr:hypothetical protein [Chitinophagales bacterium]
MLQSFLSLLVGLLAYYYVTDSIGSSTAILKILDGYDHDVFQDLLLYEGTGWTMIKSFMVAVSIIYLIIGPFISGGLLYSFNEGHDKWSVFWHGGSVYYASMLKINLIQFFGVGILLGFLSWLGAKITNYGMENFLSEVPILIILGGLITLFVMITIFIVSVSVTAKWVIITQDHKAWKSFRSSLHSVSRKLPYFLILGLSFIILSLIYLFITNFIINFLQESTLPLILLAVLLQVCFIYGRGFIRNGYYAAILKLKS